MSANKHIDELLSGFLDGELSAEELHMFESAMAADGTLAIKLEQFRQLGADLRSLPKRTLGPKFADRVLAAVQQELAVNESLAVRLPYSKPEVVVDHARRNGWRVAGVAVALAASLLFAVFVSQRFSASDEDLTQFASGDSASKAIDSQSISSSESKKINESTVRNDPGLRKRIASPSFPILTILEIEPSLKAWNENEFSKALNDAGIAWTKPVNVSDEVIGVLNDTRSISRGLPKAGDEQLALVMVTASGRQVEKAIKQIMEDVGSFPHVLMDLAFDLPGKELFEKLIDANGQQAIATPIVVESVGNGNVDKSGLEAVSQFSGTRPAQYLATSSRQVEQSRTGITDEEENSLSHVLIVVRKPAK